MKSFYLLIIMLIGLTSYGQETFYKNYKIRNFIDFLNDNKYSYDYDMLSDEEKKKVKFLSKEKCINYYQLSPSKKRVVDAQIKLVEDRVLEEIKLKDCSGNILIVNENNFNNVELYKLIGVTSIVRAKTFGSLKDNTKTYKAGLKLEKGKLYVNLWPFIESTNSQLDEGVLRNIKTEKNKITKEEQFVEVEKKEDESKNIALETREVLFYEMPDDHTAIFKFTEWNVNAITIPLKYRFQTNRSALDKSDETDIKQITIRSEEFSNSINLTLFGGHSWGRTKFTHRKKVGDRINTIKNTLGAFLGSSAVQLSPINTNILLNQPQGDAEGTIGTISFGVGFIRSWNKISIGFFTGIDKGVGRVSKSWIYDGKPWLGIGIGYDLFKL